VLAEVHGETTEVKLSAYIARGKRKVSAVRNLSLESETVEMIPVARKVSISLVNLHIHKVAVSLLH
jgi:hypothetical protein